MCTTLAKHGNLSGNEVCGSVDNVTGEFIEGSVWHSCEEWCLSKVIRMIRFILTRQDYNLYNLINLFSRYFLIFAEWKSV